MPAILCQISRVKMHALPAETVSSFSGAIGEFRYFAFYRVHHQSPTFNVIAASNQCLNGQNRDASASRRAAFACRRIVGV